MTVQTVGFLADPSIPRQQSQIAQLAQNYLGTGAYPQIQHSEMLAQALQNMQAHGSDNIRSSTALGTNLLAEALLQYGSRRANKSLINEINAGQSKALANSLLGTGLDTPQQAPAAVPPSAGTPPAPTPPVASAGGPLAMAPAPPGPQSGGRMGEFLQALVDRGLPANAAMGLVGNFAQESGPNLDRDNPSEGAIGAANWRGSRAKAAGDYFASHGGPTIPNQADFVMSELKGPEAQAYARLLAANDPASGAAAGLAYERPAGYTPNGDPSAASGWPNRLASAQSLAGGPQIAPTQGMPPQPPQPGPAQPYQIASAGQQTPPPPMPPPQAQGAPPQPQAPMPPPQMPQAPQVPQGPPTGPQATPQEAAIIRQYLSFPQGSGPWAQGMAMLQEIQKRASSPLDPPKGMMWGPDGRAMPVPGNEYRNVQGAPNERLQQDPFGQYHSTADPAYGALPQGSHLGPGGLSQIPAEAQKTFRIPGAAGTWAMGPDGIPKKVADDQFGVSDVLKVRDSAMSSKPAEEYGASNSAWKAMVANAGKPNGMSAYAMRDTFARAINPGAVARVGTIQAIQEAAGLPEGIKSFFLNLKGDGNVSPELAQQILDATLPFVQAHDHALRQLNDSNGAILKRYGMNAEDVQVPMDSAPTRFVVPRPDDRNGSQPQSIPGANPGLDAWMHPARSGQGAPQGPLPTPEQAAAELARRRAARGHR